MLAQALLLVIAGLGVAGLVCLLSQAKRIARDPGAGERMLATVSIMGGIFTQTRFGSGSNGIRMIVVGLVLAACLVILVDRHRDTGRPRYPRRRADLRSGPVVAALVLWLWLFAVDISSNDLSHFVLVARFVPGVVWVVLFLVMQTGTLSLEVFTLVASAALCVLGAMLPFLSTVWRPCNQFKCGAVGKLLAGPFVSGNYFAMQAVFIGILAWYVFRGRLRVIIVLIALLVIIATGSRTSLYLFAFGGAILSVGSARRAVARVNRGHGFGRLAMSVLVPSVAVVVGVLVLYRATPVSFSNRGAIWIEGLNALRGHALFGVGSDRWEVLRAVGRVPDHFTHSVYLLMFFAGGVVALVLFGVWVAAVVFRAAAWDRLTAADLSLIVAFLGIGLIVFWGLFGIFHCARGPASGRSGRRAEVNPARRRPMPVQPGSTA